MFSSRVFWIFVAFSLASACSESATKTEIDKAEVYEELLEGSAQNENLRVFEGTDTLIQLDYEGNPIDVQLLYPSGRPKATLLVLQGWNFPITSWCDSTTLCEKALSAGYVIVCPDMGKSIYADSVYPETRKDWLKYPTRNWLVTELIPLMQQQRNMFLDENENFVVGLSTGARGALLVAMDSPGIFSGVVCLSGDYDQSAFPNDNLYKGYFGSRNLFSERWEGHENPLARIEEFKTPLYLGHGDMDKIVPVKHSELLYNAIQKNGEFRVEYTISQKSGHDYAYWGSEVDSILQFFQEEGAK